MQRLLIEDAKCDVANYGMMGFVVAAIKYKDGDRSQWLSAVEIEGMPILHLSEQSIFDDLLKNDADDEMNAFLKKVHIDEFNHLSIYDDYDEAYSSMSEDPENPAVPLVKLLFALLRGSWEDTEDLIKSTIGKYADEIDIPRTDIEEDILDDLEDEDDDEEDDDNIVWDDYSEYPFAMEIVNGNIINISVEFQIVVKEKILDQLHVSEKDLIEYLLSLYEDDQTEDKRFKLLADYDYDLLSEILGFDANERAFCPEGIGFLESCKGWETKEILDNLNFKLIRQVEYVPHGHDSNGVIYCDEY